VANSAGRHANITKTVHNILKLRQLSEVQEQMIRYKENFGIPTCAVTHVRYLAIGMSRGIILVFDHFQVVYTCTTHDCYSCIHPSIACFDPLMLCFGV
jgi:hypothetical protein